MNAELFSPVLGHCVTMKATLILNDDATPKFCKPRKLPFALKPVVGDELDCLEKQELLRRFLTQIGPALLRKTGGKVRICGDFKITINPVLKTNISTTTS